MMQIVPKWKVTVAFNGAKGPMTVWVSGQFLSNVLRALADIDFTGLEQPQSILVEKVTADQ